MSLANIQSLLNARLQSFATEQGLDVAWENRNFMPPGQALYLCTYLLPATPRAAALGTDAWDYLRGIYQVDVQGLPDKGWQSGWSIVDALRAHFWRGLRLSDSSVDLTIESVAAARALAEGPRYKVPVSITFYAYMAPVKSGA